ncbi:MAG: cation-translocating P-type ATPase [Anaerolineaceae bacterium]|jgi:Cd2+/Zn2+-exporting ATPase|nr:heavy metal translocating P-type ATPase [Anaerolineaceae bacterium]TDA67586.1 MAG: cation-translocating P-type ATPase [Chloroflexota bacterium]
MESTKIEVRVSNLDCEHDAANIERGLEGFAGLVGLKVYPKSAKVALTFNPDQTNPGALKQKLETLGFPPQKGMEMAEQPKPWKNPKVLTAFASGVLLLVGWLIGLAGAPALISTIIFIAAILIGGYYFGREAIEELIFERRIGIELLMSVAAVVASVMGETLEGAMLVFLYSISEAAEGYTEEKTRAAIKALMNLAPKVALVRRNGREQEIPVEELVVGDVFIVMPGQSMATDGEVLVGSSSVNQAPVTGESVPVEKQVGNPVFAGSINGEGALEIRATKTFADNTIARIITMVEEAQEKKGKSQRFIERFGVRYSPIVLLVGILIALVPPLFFGADWVMWITRATVFIVAAAPCALVISIPITLVASLGTGARNGVLIKGGVYVEELAKVKVVAMDKTGTLTRGEPEVTDIILIHQDPDQLANSKQEFLAAAAGIERRSGHPLAQAIVRYVEAQGIQPIELTEFRSMTGAGASACLDGRTIYVGSPDLFHSKLGVSLEHEWGDINHLQGEGKTVVLLGDEQAPWGMIAIRDNIRPNAQKAIDALHAAGIDKVVMLTGDNERTAQAIAKELGIDEVYADLKPEDKAIKVRELTSRYGHVAMVGDGVNDAPALAEATVGVAMGAAGTDVALETADVALMADDLEKLAYALRLAKRNQSVVNQNLALSAIVISVLIIGAVGGWFTLPIAVLAHEISEFVVIGSGLRMLRS